MTKNRCDKGAGTTDLNVHERRRHFLYMNLFVPEDEAARRYYMGYTPLPDISTVGVHGGLVVRRENARWNAPASFTCVIQLLDLHTLQLRAAKLGLTVTAGDPRPFRYSARSSEMTVVSVSCKLPETRRHCGCDCASRMTRTCQCAELGCWCVADGHVWSTRREVKAG